MLARIMAAIQAAQRPVCLADLRRELDIEASALEGMLETLVARGRLRALRFDEAGCGGCPVRSGCFIMDDGVAVTYALVSDAPAVGTAALARLERVETPA
jgi:hypothetical protein